MNNLNELYLTSCVVKIASLCNLNCTYCYVYNKGDESYKQQPKTLSNETIEVFFNKLKNYFKNYNQESFTFVFHGGEPLLASKETISYFVDKAIQTCDSANIKAKFGIQTNGILLDEEWAEFLIKKNIHVGISIDTTKESNDQNRIFHNGKSSYDKIIKGYNTLKNKSNYTPGILSVIDTNVSPKEVFDHFKSINASYVNLLFPDDNYNDNFIDDLTLGKWLFEFYELWLIDKSIKIDQFEVLLLLFYGAEFIGDEYYGRKKLNTFILETNGEIQANDPLRICQPNSAKTKLNINKNEIQDLNNLEISKLYYNSKLVLCKKCEECILSEICAGGYVINRYSTENGFNNPSIYCKSLAYFITKVQNSIVEHSQNLILNSEIEKIELSELLNYCEKDNYEKNYFLESFKKN